MADVTKVEIGTAEVTVDGVSIGHSKGEIIFTYEPEFHEMTVNLYGNTPFDLARIGERAILSVPMAEYTFDNLDIAMPGHTKSATKITAGGQVGDRLAANAVEVVAHPVSKESSDRSQDLILWKAIVMNAIEMPYQVDGERIMTVEFLALIDESRSDGDQLFMIGDSTT